MGLSRCVATGRGLRGQTDGRAGTITWTDVSHVFFLYLLRKRSFRDKWQTSFIGRIPFKTLTD